MEKEGTAKYIGRSYTLKGIDTLYQKLMTISKPSDTWMLGIQLPNEPAETMFSMKKMDVTSFVFESKENEFSNLIRYESKKGRLDAEISGGNLAISFTFDKM